jgi:branched-chain amino acid transport system substrate-binding protein
MNMLATAFRQSKSTAPTQVAYALEGMKYKSPEGEVEMRRTDHQLLGPLYLGIWAKQDGKRVKYDAENTGYGFRVDAAVDTYVSAQPTSCQMKRPPKP